MLESDAKKSHSRLSILVGNLRTEFFLLFFIIIRTVKEHVFLSRKYLSGKDLGLRFIMHTTKVSGKRRVYRQAHCIVKYITALYQIR